MQLNKNHLNRIILKGRSRDPAERFYYNRVFQMWRDAWFSAFKELDNADRIFSDDFKRQDEILALMHGNEPLGCASFQWMNLRNAEDRIDSTFKPWPEPLLAKLADEGGDNMLVCSYFAISLKYVGQEFDIHPKHLLFALSLKRFLESGANFMVATVRNNRHMNVMSYNSGAEALLKNQSLHGVDVDLVRWWPRKVSMELAPKMTPLINEIWNRDLKAIEIKQAA